MSRQLTLDTYLLTGMVQTLDLGDDLFVIFRTTDFGSCPFIGIVRTIDVGHRRQVGIATKI